MKTNVNMYMRALSTFYVIVSRLLCCWCGRTENATLLLIWRYSQLCIKNGVIWLGSADTCESWMQKRPFTTRRLSLDRAWPCFYEGKRYYHYIFPAWLPRLQQTVAITGECSSRKWTYFQIKISFTGSCILLQSAYWLLATFMEDSLKRRSLKIMFLLGILQ